ncbi:MAG TPA: serine/threonine-protein kinase [Candidatus Acidoferrum sp.]|nr:serine/threonine-protein kinase [Candidatus Acidoferrum sp.]
MALAVGQRFGDYEILGELGRGGMGAVYQARQFSLQRVVALKILPPHVANDPGLTARFEAEAIAVASLNHPNIVQVFAAGEHDGIRFIAMEYVEGESIGQRLKRCGRLPMTEALDVAYHVAAALDYAWLTAQLIHRDVKPDNIFLAANGTVKLGDFGIAKILREGASSVTMTGHVMGSPHFISPEQAHGHRDIDFRADIYSLGCAVHYMMTGRTVFEGPDFVSIILKHVNEEPATLSTLLPDCPVAIQELIARMLSKNREQRPQSYAELIGKILLARDEVTTWETSDARQRRRNYREQSANTSSRSIYVLAALVPFLIAGGYVYSKLHEQPPPRRETMTTLADASDRRDFIHSVSELAPLARIETVMEKLREVNPAFKGRERFTFEGDMITELSLPSKGVTNLWPITALRYLMVFRCTGSVTNQQRGDLMDLSPLAELSELVEVDVSWNPLHDLGPLRQVPLRILSCANTRVENLSPLQGREITELDISETRVRDLKPLAGMPLLEFRCNNARVSDLSALRNAPLRIIRADSRGLNADLVKSWKEIESINGLSLEEASKRLRQKGSL